MSMQLGSESVAPPWDSIPGQVLCPLCEYDLRGLAEPRCPECGFTFTWAQVLDPTCRLHPYLFEHHPEHSAWAFRKTFVAALLPRRFWRNLHPAQPSCPRRLILYWLLASLLSWIVVVAGGIGQISWHWQATFKVNAAYGAQQLAYWKGLQISEVKRARAIKEFGSLENAVDAWYPTHWTWALFIDILRARYGLLMVPLLPAALPWLTFASLMIFRMSMRQAKVKLVHVLRCAIYTGGTWLCASLAVATYILAIPVLSRYSFVAAARKVTWALCLIVCLVIVYQLAIAYRRYLKFPNAIGTVLAAEFVAVLGVITGLQFFQIRLI